MEKDCYRILGIDENILNYILSEKEGNYNFKNRPNTNKDAYIRNAFEEKKKRIKDKFEKIKDDLTQKHEKSVTLKKYRYSEYDNE